MSLVNIDYAVQSFNKSKWWSFYEEAAFEATIIAEVFIPSQVTSLPFVSSIDLKKLIDEKPIKTILKASLNSSGHLIVNQHVDWIPLLRLASNCEEQNIEVCPTQFPGAVILRTIKPIKEGEELKVWLSTDLLALLEIPFLTPSNIINHQIYKCTNCSKTFSQPNPLKVHLAYDCHTLKSRTTSLVSPLSQFILPDGIRILDHVHVQMVNNTATFIDGNNNKSGSSAISSNNSKQSMPTKEPKTHVCVFCGKLYTRKYGLKIHLRTHTGHKPLSCRFCGRPFSDPSNLNKHIRLHAHHNHYNTFRAMSMTNVSTNDDSMIVINNNDDDSDNLRRNHLPRVSTATDEGNTCTFKCNLCGKFMVRKRDLERHLRVRHGIN